MKIRSGFVSNSSSSSFVIITTKDNYDKVMKDATAYEKAVAEALFSAGEKFLLTETMIATTYNDNGGGGTWEGLTIETEPDKDEHGDDIEPCDAFNGICEKLGESKHEVISVDVEM